MVQGGLKKVAKKEQKATVAHKRSKVTRKGKRGPIGNSTNAKAKKKLLGCYTAGLEGNIVGKMNPSEREKMRVVSKGGDEKKLGKKERKAIARQNRRESKRV